MIAKNKKASRATYRIQASVLHKSAEILSERRPDSKILRLAQPIDISFARACKLALDVPFEEGQELSSLHHLLHLRLPSNFNSDIKRAGGVGCAGGLMRDRRNLSQQCLSHKLLGAAPLTSLASPARTMSKLPCTLRLVPTLGTAERDSSPSHPETT